MSDGAQNSPPPLRSRFADDPEMAELVGLFLGDLPRKIDALQGAFEQGKASQVARIAHQLKGAADGYGFASITEAAAALESALGDDSGQERRMDELRTRVDELVSLCARAARGVSGGR